MITRRSIFVMITLLLGAGLLIACKKNEEVKHSVLYSLHQTYPNHAIAECSLHTQPVYCFTNMDKEAAFETSVVFDTKGNLLFSCIPNGIITPRCVELDSCRTVFMPKNNRLNAAALDVYGLLLY